LAEQPKATGGQINNLTKSQQTGENEKQITTHQQVHDGVAGGRMWELAILGLGE